LVGEILVDFKKNRKILMIDNYDSFTYNLVQYLRILSEEVIIKRNNQLTIEDIQKMSPAGIVISPGPKAPKEAGISLEVIKQLKEIYPILGICLGMQAIGEAFGGDVIKGIEPVHGKVHSITHDGEGVFQGLKNPLMVTRYHSLVLDRKTLPSDLIITAETEAGEIMGIRHKSYDIEGVQFHPEAYLSEMGLELIGNFVKKCSEGKNEKI